MDFEDIIRRAIVEELRRQADGEAFTFGAEDEASVTVNGRIDLEELSLAIMGALSGGP